MGVKKNKVDEKFLRLGEAGKLSRVVALKGWRRSSTANLN